jgi:hypothetical protein
VLTVPPLSQPSQAFGNRFSLSDPPASGQGVTAPTDTPSPDGTFNGFTAAGFDKPDLCVAKGCARP